MDIRIPDLALVVVLGPDDTRAADFAARHFQPWEIVEGAAARERLARGLLAVVDASGAPPAQRQRLSSIGRKASVDRVAIVLDGALPPAMLEAEGFRPALDVPTSTDVRIVRERLPVDRRDERGPFDVVGDVHGCGDELEALVSVLGGRTGRTTIFLGDLVDRGPYPVEVLERVLGMVERGEALCLPGNHDVKLLRALQGRSVKVAPALAATVEQVAAAGPEFRARVVEFLATLESHYVLDEGRLVVAHAGLPTRLHGRRSRRVFDHAIYGDPTGETDPHGHPVRRDWAASYQGEALVVYGHTPVDEPRWVNRTINIDTGCVFGGHLTALRYPELELVSVPARRTYCYREGPGDPPAPPRGSEPG